MHDSNLILIENKANSIGHKINKIVIADDAVNREEKLKAIENMKRSLEHFDDYLHQLKRLDRKQTQ